MPPEQIPKSGLSGKDIVEQKIHLADTYVSVGKYERALAVLHEVLTLNPDHFHAHLQLGYCYLHLNKLREGYREAEEAIHLRPDHAGGYRLLAYLSRHSGNFAAAMQAIDQALEINPADHSMYTLRASLYLGMGNSRKAIVEAKKGLSIYPESEQASHILAIALCNQNRQTETLRLTYQALRKNPMSSLAWYQKGVQLRLAGKLRAAKYAFFQALSINPEMNEAKEQLDQVLVPSLPWHRPEKLLLLLQAIILFVIIIILAVARIGIIFIILFAVRNKKKTIQIFPPPKTKLALYNWDITAWEKVQRREAAAFQGMEAAEELIMAGQLNTARIALRPALRYAPLDPVIQQSCLTALSGHFILRRWFWQLLFWVLRTPGYVTFLVFTIFTIVIGLLFIDATLSWTLTAVNLWMIILLTIECSFLFLKSSYIYLRWGWLRI